jgi:predicted transcriptional regulator
MNSEEYEAELETLVKDFKMMCAKFHLDMLNLEIERRQDEIVVDKKKTDKIIGDTFAYVHCLCEKNRND